MILVAGHLIVDPQRRTEYLERCRPVIVAARRTEGCLEFSVSADLVAADRVQIFEAWDSLAALTAFRGDGPGDDLGEMIRSARVRHYEVDPSP